MVASSFKKIRSSLRPRRVFVKLKSKMGFFKFRSVKFEIGVIYTAILAVILISFSGVIYAILAHTLYAELDNEVKIKAEEVAQNIRAYLEIKGDQPATLLYAVEKTIASEDKTLRRWWYVGFERIWLKRLDEQDLSKDYINFVSSGGTSMVHSSNISDTLLGLFLNNAYLNNGKERFYYIDHAGKKIRVINYPFLEKDNQLYIIQVGVSPEPVVQLLGSWMDRVILGIPVLLILTSSIGRLLASRILKPVQKITEAANAVSLEGLNRRVKLTHHYREMDSLVQSFNKMISRLEKSFKHIEQFSSYMAHEIKTPLTIMKGETELALLVTRSPQEYQDALKVNLEEIEKMLTIVEDLLFLTKMDYQPGCLRFEYLNLSDYFREIYEQSIFLAKKKDIDVSYDSSLEDESIRIHADPLHLRRLFFNLIDNAVKFTPPKGKIMLSLCKEHKYARVSIADTGKGIPDAEKQKIFERFYRINTQEEGSGLGLSIVRSIVDAHAGHIEVHSRPNQGAIFSVLLPIASPS